VVDYNVPVLCGGVLVNPGDLIFADYDGIVAVPVHLIAEVFEQAKEKVLKEKDSRKELFSGAYLSQVYAKYGVL
jgi:4-hydroxy-4-methyl-2-oxoglutarate aldolase